LVKKTGETKRPPNEKSRKRGTKRKKKVGKNKKFEQKDGRGGGGGGPFKKVGVLRCTRGEERSRWALHTRKKPRTIETSKFVKGKRSQRETKQRREKDNGVVGWGAHSLGKNPPN